MNVKYLSLILCLSAAMLSSFVENGVCQFDTSRAIVLWERRIEESTFCWDDSTWVRLNFSRACLDREGSTLVLLGKDTCEYPGPAIYQVRKYDAQGMLQWAHGKIASGNEARSTGIATDARGNVYVTEEHAPVWSLDPMYNRGTQIVSVSGDGLYRWSDLYKGPTEKSGALGPALVAAADSLHVYVVSWDLDAVQLLVYSQGGAGPQITDILPNDIPELIRITSNGDLILVGNFVHKYSSAGVPLAHSISLGEPISVATDGDGNIYCLSLLHIGSTSVHLTKLDSMCAVVWQKSYNNDAQRPTIVMADDDGNVTIITAATYDYHRMVAKYRTDGSLLWRQDWTADNEFLPIDATTDVLGNYFTIDTACTLRSYDPDGVYLWSRPIGNPWHASWGPRLTANSEQNYLHIDSYGDLHVTVGASHYNNGEQVWHYFTSVARLTQPKTFDILDARGDSIASTAFHLIKVHNDPPVYTEDTLGVFETNYRGQFVFPFAGINSYQFPATALNPVADTLWPGDTIKIAKLVDTQPAVRHQGVLGTIYSVHLDNGEFDVDGRLVFDTVQFGSIQQIRLRHTEYRYNLVASVEWDAELAYLEGLTTDFRQMSNYLYDVSDGQIRLDTVVILDNKEGWADADVRITAENTYWPNADIMGIGLVGLEPITMPRKWCGSADSSRAFTYILHPLADELSDNYRTLAHELGHFGMAFDDEYLFADANGNAVPTPAGCTPYPAGNFGFMSSQYDRTTSGEHASEMSSEYRYQNPGCTNTRQWVFNNRTCWDDFEYWAERYRNGIFVPILKPSLTDPTERLTPIGMDYFPGPNNDLYALNYDVGQLIQFPVMLGPPSNSNKSMHVTVSGVPVGGVAVSVVKNGVIANQVEQGMTTDAGRIWALGVNQFTDAITASGWTFSAVFSKSSGVAAESSLQRGWLYGHVQLSDGSSRTSTTASLSAPGDSLTMILKPVQGYYPLVCQATLNGAGWDYGMFFERAFSQYPQYEIGTEKGDHVSGYFTAGTSSYGTPVADYLTSTGSATVWATDDSAQAFFFETPFAVMDITSSAQLKKVIGPEGSVVAWIDTLNVGIQRVMILSSPYPPMLRGLDSGALQGGRTHSISCYPDMGLAGANSISILYTDDDLKNGSGLFVGSESTLRVYRWNTTEEQWILVGGSVDTVRNLVAASVTLSGTYGAFTLYSNSSCCTGPRGNVDMQGIIDLSDLSLLIRYLTTPNQTLPCVDEANIDGSSIIDLSDLSLLIGYLTREPRPTIPNCP